MTFAEPAYLLVLALLVPIAAIGLTRGERRARDDLVRFGEPALLARSSSLPTARGRFARWGLALAAMALLVVGLARPQLGAERSVVQRSGGDVLFLLDLSRSMMAEDVAPSRLAAAKRAAAVIAGALPDDRVGVIVFGGSAFLQLPPTLDHSTFRLFLDAASTTQIPDAATEFEGAASVTAAAFARGADVRYGAAVLLSDGEDVEGKLYGAIGTLKAARIRTFAVGFGTPEGATIPERDAHGAPAVHRDWAGRVVVTRLVEDNLRDIARETGGRYVRWSGDASVAPIIAALADLRRREVAARATPPGAERFQWPLALALGLLVAEAALGRKRGAW